MTTLTITEEHIDILTDILATPDPQPADPWIWRSWTEDTPSQSGPMTSIGQLYDLIAQLPDEGYLVIKKRAREGVWTQCYRKADRFQTEFNLWTGGEYTLCTLADPDGLLPMTLCRLVMAAYVQSNGKLPHLEGYTTQKVDY